MMLFRQVEPPSAPPCEPSCTDTRSTLCVAAEEEEEGSSVMTKDGAASREQLCPAGGELKLHVECVCARFKSAYAHIRNVRDKYYNLKWAKNVINLHLTGECNTTECKPRKEK